MFEDILLVGVIYYLFNSFILKDKQNNYVGDLISEESGRMLNILKWKIFFCEENIMKVKDKAK